jgi:hypothetical protein
MRYVVVFLSIFYFYQYSLSDFTSTEVLPLSEMYCLISPNPLKIPSIAKMDGALVVGNSAQQVCSNFLI